MHCAGVRKLEIWCLLSLCLIVGCGGVGRVSEARDAPALADASGTPFASDDDSGRRREQNDGSLAPESTRDASLSSPSDGAIVHRPDAASPRERLIAVDLDNTSELLGLDPDLRLSYAPDALGNVVPDFSSVGYEASERAIPTVATAERVEPGAGDDSARIQAAIDRVAKLSVGADGFRGAVELAAGTYEVGTTLALRVSGIVLRGAGVDAKSGTTLIATGTTQRNAIELHGTGSAKEIADSRRAVADAYVPVGAKRIPLASTSGLKLGDAVVVFRPGTDAWIHAIGMDQIEEREGTVQWTAAGYSLPYERVITAIDEDAIEIDAPIMTALDPQYGGGSVYRYAFAGRIDHVGVEALRLVSTYASGQETSDESHAWTAIDLAAVEHAWVRRVAAQHFGYSGVRVSANARFVTIEDSENLDPVSQITGGRRYSFNVEGQRVLVQRCHARGGRHDYVTGSRVLGPNVFLDSDAIETHSDIGPHQRWATGVLYDNVHGGEINLQDRGNYGTGHGWAGANHVMWNDEGTSLSCQKPPTANNWCIGFIGARSKGRFSDREPGVWEALGRHLTPRSLFLAQLEDAMGATAVLAITTEQQRE